MKHTESSIDKSAERQPAAHAGARLRESVDWVRDAGAAASAQGSVKSFLDSTRLELVSGKQSNAAAENSNPADKPADGNKKPAEGDKKPPEDAKSEPLTEEQKKVREREVREDLDRLKDEREPTDIWVLKEDAAAAREIVDRWKRENRFARVEIHETDADRYKRFKEMSRGEYLNLNACHKYMFPTAEDTRKMPKNHPMQWSAPSR